MSETNNTCYNHPDRAAIETCEVCGRGLCGYCLYYTDDGQRLCESHAQQAKLSGTRIIPPAVYADGIIPSQAVAREREGADIAQRGAVQGPVVIYRGNNQDIMAYTAMLLGLLSATMCFGIIYCLPFAAALLGIVGLLNSKDAVDPRRTRTQSMIALLTGGVISAVCIGCIVLYVSIYGLAFASFSANTNPYNYPAFPSPTFTVAPPESDTPSPLIEPMQRTATAQVRRSPTPSP